MNRFNSTFRVKPSRLKAGRRTLNCKVCRTPFQAWPYRIRDGVKCCSTKCAGVLKRNRSVHTCTFCGNEFTRSISQVFYRGAKYCSKPCAHKGQIAECANRPVRDKWGRSNRHADKQWQKAVRDKDDYTCQRCGKREPYIHAHHVAPRSRRPDLKYEVSNGKCLCSSCHSWVHEHPIEAAQSGLLSGETYELARKKVEGTQHGMAKFTAEEVRAVRARHSAGERADDIARDIGVNRSCVFRIVSGQTYKNVA